VDFPGSRRPDARNAPPSVAWRRAAVLGVAGVMTAATAALAMPSPTVRAAPAPPFNQCPGVGLDTSCAILIVIQPDGSLTILRDATQRPIDGSEDTLLGVQNNSAVTVPSISIGSATVALFGLENDGICTFIFVGDGYCTATPPPATGYEGPDTTFGQISVNKKRGTVHFTDSGGGLAAGATTFFSLEGALTASNLISGAATSLTFTNTSFSSDVADPLTVSATLTAAAVPVPGATLVFTLGTGSGADTCTGTTDSSGVASCSITPTQPAGSYQLTTSFAGSSIPFLAGVNTTAPFAVTLEQDALTYTGGLAVVAGQPLVLSGALTTDDPAAGTPLAGKSISLTLGSGVTAQTCVAVTDAAGAATCTIASVKQSPGSVGASARFAGDAFYVAAAAVGGVTVTAPAVPPAPPSVPGAGVGTPDTGGAGEQPAAPAAMLIVAGGWLTAAAVRRRRPHR
jgi:hypothetical protein